MPSTAEKKALLSKLASYDESLSVRPRDADTLKHRGNVLFDLGRYDDALDNYNESLKVEPRDAVVLSNHGTVLNILGRHADALQSLNKSLGLRPGDAHTLTVRGDALNALGDHTLALNSYNESLGVRPGHARTLSHRGDVLFDLGRYDDALDNYNESLKVEPRNAVVLSNHGTVLNILGRHADALQSLNKSLGLRPGDAHTLTVRGDALNALGDHTLALDSYNESLGVRPGHARTLYHRGNVLFDLGRYKDALDNYNESLKVEPGDEHTLAARRYALNALYDHPHALDNKFLGVLPEHASPLYDRGNVFYVLGRYNDALDNYDESLRVRPRNAKVLINRGKALYKLRRFGEALESFNNALALETSNAISLRYKELTLKELGHSAQAAEPLSAAEEESKDEKQEKPSATLDPFPTYSLKAKSPNYLLLEEIPANAYYVIGTPALKSSGDIYHIVPYLAFAKKLGLNLPIVLLAHDETQDTKKQAKLAADFVSLFGLDETIVKIRQVESTYRPASRTAGLRTYVVEQSPICYFIDQKAVTLFLATLFKKHGFAKMSRDLREALLDATTETRRQHRNEILLLYRWVDARFSEIKKAAADRPIVFLNRRLACGSNSEHDIDEYGWKQIEACLKTKNIFYWYLVAASKPGSILAADKNKTFLFSHDTTIGTRNENEHLDATGFYKLRHVLLLARLLDIPQLIGMAGNTSGTLDIAALLGYRTYSFHNFTNTSGVDYLDAQDYRILMQHPFLSIGLKPRADIRLTDESRGFTTWLESKEKDTLFPALPNRTIRFTTKGKPYDKRDCRLPFSGALTWKKAGDTRVLTDFPQVTIHTDGEKLQGTHHVKFKFFDEMDNCLVKKLNLANQTREEEVILSNMKNLKVSPSLPPRGLAFFPPTPSRQSISTPAGTPSSFSPPSIAKDSSSCDGSFSQTPSACTFLPAKRKRSLDSGDSSIFAGGGCNQEPSKFSAN